jgi:hypothetical protein
VSAQTPEAQHVKYLIKCEVNKKDRVWNQDLCFDTMLNFIFLGLLVLTMSLLLTSHFKISGAYSKIKS